MRRLATKPWLNLDTNALNPIIVPKDAALKDGSPLSIAQATKSSESVNVHLLHQLSSSADDVPDCTPVIHCEQNDFTYTSIPLNIDVVVMTTKTTPVSQLPRLFSKGISNQLIAMEDCMLTYYQNEKFHIPESYHFSIPGFQHLLNVVYPRDKSEEELESHRRNLHTKLVIPLDKPLLRRTRRYVFTEERNKEGYLTNTHIGLPQSGDGQMYIVSGVYSYHHYMQDRIDDNGWGCAYRSLQTICSWFRHQGYVDRPVPTHKEIQQALVDVGDKPSKFVGSRQWIGSIEVSTCLDQLLGVTSKIMFVNNGTDLGNKGRELAVHFQTQGTPIMIGGGVLAHTILGVDFNEVTGQVKFLILDPHYTGGEDLKVIQDKGWCGWKSEEFWDKTAYYNLCMPQRPHVI
ncbi:ufm1-specific protease 2-like [Saccoglossus kowalevskii]|uniref:Ufm1-specific protease 2-like n=1 Tax=Saccoglossus kowalevskii TaxID=10224 RepID=A0ABM0GSU6_SACKO|nr:PREDICTED: ufm1-specific protease 2-like [Saccoglossus kowalevskii]